MNVTINGNTHELAEAISAAEMLETLGVDTERAAVELNGRVLAREKLGETVLSKGDEIEIVRFVSGG